MKIRRKLYFTIVIISILTLCAGSYAYAFSTDSITISVTEANDDIASSNVTATQPSWSDVLINKSEVVYFRPNANGDETTITDQYPAEGEHWDKVDEVTSDNDSTYVATLNQNWEEDIYNINDHSTQTVGGAINYIKIYAIARTTANTTQTNLHIRIKTEGVVHDGSEESLTTSYDTYSYQWDINPETSANWTWAEIDALQVGVGIRRPDVGEYTQCTQVYAEIGFEAPPLSGNTPTGNLFVVTPHPEYTGDLAVKLYLANTADLTRAYQSLNMNLYLEDSLEAGQTPSYRVLNIDNGIVTFKLEDGGSDNHTLSVIGGNYTLYSREISEWDADWTVVPEIYCEVVQR
ncbi:hypothetical protein ACFLW0_03500 [Chloroflexota bacterium]